MARVGRIYALRLARLLGSVRSNMKLIFYAVPIPNKRAGGCYPWCQEGKLVDEEPWTGCKSIYVQM